MKITKQHLRKIISESTKSVNVEGYPVSVGDSIGFKEDIEQEAEIVKIEPGGWITVKAPPMGFEGEYIRNRKTHRLRAEEAWLVSDPPSTSGYDPGSRLDAELELEQMIMVDVRNDMRDDPSASADELASYYLDSEPWISSYGLEQQLLDGIRANMVESKNTKITKRQLRAIIKEEKQKILLEQRSFDNEEILAMAEEAGVYFKDMHDVPAAAEEALQKGLLDLGTVDAAAEELQDFGANSPADVLVPGFDWWSPVYKGSMGAVRTVSDAIKELRSEQGRRWPIHPNLKFAKSSYLPMLVWILTR